MNTLSATMFMILSFICGYLMAEYVMIKKLRTDQAYYQMKLFQCLEIITK